MERKQIKRNRSENWLDEDKILLQELIKDRVQIIENKNTDTTTNRAKIIAWNDVVNSYNSLCRGVSHTIPQLKSQWGTIKMFAKKKAAHKSLSLKTAGDPPPAELASNSDGISAWLSGDFVIDRNKLKNESSSNFNDDSDPGMIEVVKNNSETIIKNKSLKESEIIKNEPVVDLQIEDSQEQGDPLEPTNMNDKTKRVRCENWTEKEKAILLRLVEKSIGVLESKKTHTDINKAKQLEWDCIEKRFEIITGVKRKKYKLKDLWKRLKLTAKRNIFNYYKLIDTGNADYAKVSDFDWRVKELLLYDFTKHSHEGNGSDIKNVYRSDELHRHGERDKIDIEIDEDSGSLKRNYTSNIDIAEAREHKTDIINNDKVKRKERFSNIENKDILIDGNQEEDFTNMVTTRDMEAKYFRTLIKRKNEEYDLKIKHMTEIHNLEVKKRKLEIELLEKNIQNSVS